MPGRVLELLRSMDIFADLPDAELARIGRLLKVVRAAENDLIFAEGEVGDALYVVLQGRVRIATTDHLGRERVLAFNGPGEFFGDMAVLTGAPRSAKAVASTAVRLLQLRKDDFDALVATNVTIMRVMLRVMVERQSTMNTRVTHAASASAGGVRGQISVVFSPRGGAGQTLLATNLGVALAELSPDGVVVVDLDLLFGHVAMLLDLSPRTALAAITPAAVRGLDRDGLGFYLVKHADSSLRLLAGCLRPEDSELVTADHVHAMLDLLRRHFAHVVVDAGSRFSEPCLAALELADQVLVVCTPEPQVTDSVRDCQRVLREVLAIPAERVRFVQNHPSPYSSQSPVALAGLLGLEHVIELPFGGEEVSQAGLHGVPLIVRRPSNPASRVIVALARELDETGRELLAVAAS